MGQRIAVFDVNETLFRVDSLRHFFAGVDCFHAEVVLDGLALAASGEFVPFAEIARHHLHRMIPCSADADRMMDAFSDLDPFEDVRPALAALRRRGLRIVTLTNGNAATTAAMLERATLSECVERNYDATLANAWKPRPEIYLALAHELDVPPSGLIMVTAHPWDVHGAKRAGFAAGWVNRSGAPYPAYARAPDLEAKTLVELAEMLPG